MTARNGAGRRPAFTIAACAAALLTLCGAAHAQIDKAYDSGQVDRFDDAAKAMIAYAEQGNRDEAIKQLTQMELALAAIHNMLLDMPPRLSSAGLSQQADQTARTIQVLVSLKNDSQRLEDKLGRVSESFSSELSTFKSRRQEFGTSLGNLMKEMEAAGRRVKMQYQAMEFACRTCLK